MHLAQAASSWPAECVDRPHGGHERNRSIRCRADRAERAQAAGPLTDIIIPFLQSGTHRETPERGRVWQVSNPERKHFSFIKGLRVRRSIAFSDRFGTENEAECPGAARAEKAPLRMEPDLQSSCVCCLIPLYKSTKRQKLPPDRCAVSTLRDPHKPAGLKGEKQPSFGYTVIRCSDKSR